MYMKQILTVLWRAQTALQGERPLVHTLHSQLHTVVSFLLNQIDYARVRPDPMDVWTVDFSGWGHAVKLSEVVIPDFSAEKCPATYAFVQREGYNFVVACINGLRKRLERPFPRLISLARWIDPSQDSQFGVSHLKDTVDALPEGVRGIFDRLMLEAEWLDLNIWTERI